MLHCCSKLEGLLLSGTMHAVSPQECLPSHALTRRLEPTLSHSGACPRGEGEEEPLGTKCSRGGDAVCCPESSAPFRAKHRQEERREGKNGKAERRSNKKIRF